MEQWKQDLLMMTTLQDDGCPNVPEHWTVVEVVDPSVWDELDNLIMDTAKTMMKRRMDMFAGLVRTGSF